MGGKLRAVVGRGWVPAESPRERFLGKGGGLHGGAAGEFFRQNRRAGNRCRAATAEEARVRNAAVHDARRELEDVAADGVAHFDRSSGVGKRAGVARVAKMIENSFAEHNLRSQRRKIALR